MSAVCFDFRGPAALRRGSSALARAGRRTCTVNGTRLPAQSYLHNRLLLNVQLVDLENSQEQCLELTTFELRVENCFESTVS